MSKESKDEVDKDHVPQEPNEDDLEGKLKHLGLDPKKWLPLLSQILGVTNVQVLEHTGIEDYLKVKKKAEHPWEKNSLQKLFNIKNEVRQIQDERVKKLKNNQEASRKTLEELEKMMNEGKTRLSKGVSEHEEKMRNSMDIPKESWPSSSEPLQAVIEKLHKELDMKDEVLENITTLSDKDVMLNASGGLGLEGIYMSKKHDDVLKKREQLIALPEQFHLTSPQKSPVFDQKEFLSSTTELTFNTTMVKLGYSIASSAKGGFWGIQAEASLSRSSSTKSKHKKESQKEETYICSTRYNYIPLASCYIAKDQLRLTEAALKDLQSTEELARNSNAADQHNLTRHRYEHFFHRFGSHANQGPIHFGGIFWWKATSQGFREDKLEEIRKENSENLNVYVGVSYLGKFSAAGVVDKTNTKSETTFDRKKERTLKKQTQLYVTKTGGPLIADSHGSWKCGLLANNKTWSVIDRGFSLLPVWEIILFAHKQDFLDVYQFSKNLIKAYEDITNQPQQLLFGENISSALDEARSFLSDLSSWEVTPAEQQLRRLLDFRQRLNDRTRNFNVWVNICLSDKRLQHFLEKIIESNKKAKSDAALLRSQIKCLLQYYESSHENLTSYSSIIKWLYQSEENQKPVAITDFLTFINFLSQSKTELKCARNTDGSDEEEQIKMNMNILSAINMFLKVLKHTGQTDLKLLVISVMSSVGYSVRNNDFQYLLGWQEIKFMEMELQRLYKDYYDLYALQARRAHAFLLKTCLTAGEGGKPKSVEQKRALLHYMVEDMRCNLDQEILDVLEKHSRCINFHSLQKDLDLFITDCGADMKQKTEEITNKLRMVCQTASADISPALSSSLEQNTEQSETTTKQEFTNLIQNLGLEKYFPKKMTRKYFCNVSRASLDNLQTEGDLPPCFAQMLMTLDYRLRYLVCNIAKEDNNSINGSLSTPTATMFDTADDFLNDFPKEEDVSTKQVRANIHPADVLMSLFHCADDFTRQYMYYKLSLCHFALPLLVPKTDCDAIELPLWSFRLVQKSIIVHGQSGTRKPQEKLIYDVDLPFVCFTRLGKSNISKSQILNNLLSTSKHDVFYHRNCKGCETKPILMEGVAEIFWFCPSGKDENQYESCTAFVNLHGDARKQSKQCEFLLKISAVNILLFSEAEMDKNGKDLLTRMLRSNKPLICLCPDREFSPGNNTASQVKIGLKNQNEATVLEELFRTLKRLLTISEKSYSLETIAQIGRNCGFTVDEDGAECAEGKASDTRLLGNIQENNLIKSKDKLLPISGQLWHSWCKKDKELTRLENKMKRSIEQHKGEIESEKIAIRKKQLERTENNEFMLSFITELKSLRRPTKMFFLQWFKLFIDHLSGDQISELQYQYSQLWSSLQTEKSKSNTLSAALQQDMDKLSTKINASAFGLEHILRELGQTYEVLSELKYNDECFLELPKIAADMMASGYPIELMDGDASYLPLKWIGSVLEELIKIIGDKKLFVLSVLGVQSSGKSTLLNTMFGLQFAVSCGRCTRGAFMQLVEIEQKLKNDLGFDFILVIDTEGLRSTEIVSQSDRDHDNKLATFVIGVGNMTLINVFGENPSEIKDILQIAVQAFLRMKQIKLNPSCLFVHQNVSEISAAVKTLEGRVSLEKELDNITCLAAEQEHCNVQRFRDVIRFDAERHIRYFAHLWLGNPPMAPPNPAYSQNAQEVRDLILHVGKTEARSLLSISELRVRIEDLWQALKNENFVFSFKNTLEISAYSKLENRYNQWTWQLRRHVLDLQVKLSNKIKKGELSELKRKDVEKEVNEKFVDIDKELESFFTEDKDKEILIQWKANVKIKLQNLQSELVEETKEQGDDLLRLKKSRNKIKQKENNYEEQLFGKSKELALSIQNKDLNEDELREHFSTLWQSWVMEIKTSVPPLETPNFKSDAEDIILQYFQNVPGINDKLSADWSSFCIDIAKHISMKKKYIILTKQLTAHDGHYIKQVETNLKKKVNDYLEEKHQKIEHYNKGFFYEIINIISDDVKQTDNGNFTFTKEFNIDLSLYLFHKAVESFKDLHNLFHFVNDPVAVLENKREEFFNCFKISCEGTTSITTFANFLCSKLKDGVSSAVYNKTAIAIVEEMRCNFPALSGNRSKLEIYILIYLAEQEDYEKYRQYLHFPKQFFESYIKKCVNEYCLSGDSPKLDYFMNISLGQLHNLILSAISESTQIATDKNYNISGWLDEFYKRVEDTVSFSRSDLRGIEHLEIKYLDFIKEAMVKAWDDTMDSLKNNLNRRSFESFEIKPHKTLVKHLHGCWEQCPFCKAICTNTIPDHDGDHSVPFHRSQAINGFTWKDSKQLTTEICSTLVSSDTCVVLNNRPGVPYKDYRKLGPNYEKWSITPDTSAQPYWKWFVSHFRTNLEEDYGCKFEGRGAIPPQWEKISKEEVLAMLHEQVGTKQYGETYALALPLERLLNSFMRNCAAEIYF